MFNATSIFFNIFRQTSKSIFINLLHVITIIFADVKQSWIIPINTGIELTSGYGSRRLCCFTTPVHSLLMNLLSVEVVRISRCVDTFVWCCSCCIVGVCLGVAEYQTDCTWCNNFRRLRCFHNDFSGFCHVAKSGWRFKIFAIFPH